MLQVLAQEKVARYASLLASFNNKKGGGVSVTHQKKHMSGGFGVFPFLLDFLYKRNFKLDILKIFIR